MSFDDIKLLSRRIDGRVFEYVDYTVPGKVLFVMIIQDVNTHYILLQGNAILENVFLLRFSLRR